MNTKNASSYSFEIVSDKFFNYIRSESLLYREPILTDRNPVEKNNLKSAFLMLLAVLTYSFITLVSKFIIRDYKEIGNDTINLFRGVIMVIGSYILIRKENIDLEGQLAGDRTRTAVLFVRCLCGAFSNVLIIIALRHMRISSCVTINFTFPLIASALTVMFLNEKMTKFDIIAILCSIVCVILICKPAFLFDSVDQTVDTYFGIFAALVSCIATGVSVFLHKTISNHFHSYVVTMFFGCGFVLLSLIMMLLDQFTLDKVTLPSFCLLILLGSIFVINQNVFNMALATGDIVVVLPIYYLGIVVHFCYNVFIFKAPWDFLDIVGSIGKIIINITKIVDLNK